MSEEVEKCLSKYGGYIFQLLSSQLAENAKSCATTKGLKT